MTSKELVNKLLCPWEVVEIFEWDLKLCWGLSHKLGTRVTVMQLHGMISIMDVHGSLKK